jgi:2-polyprenyl-3-methyl-5-hydroxy-6-metoxy-1,4-benzoquinol methylase
MEDEVYYSMNQLEDKHWWFTGRRKILKKVLDDLKIDEKSTILDVGCGTGGNLSLLKQYGEVYGLEKNELAVKFARQKNIGKIIQGSMPDDIGTHQKFDLVVMLDVLEHLDNDTQALKSLLPFIKDNGYIIITVPACPMLWCQHDTYHHHRKRYIKKELEECILEANLCCNFINYYNSLLFPLAFVNRMVYKMMPFIKMKVTLPIKVVNNILEKIFSSERNLIKKFQMPMGLSVIAVANVMELKTENNGNK